MADPDGPYMAGNRAETRGWLTLARNCAENQGEFVGQRAGSTSGPLRRIH